MIQQLRFQQRHQHSEPRARPSRELSRPLPRDPILAVSLLSGDILVVGNYATLATPRSATVVDRMVDGRLLVAGGVTGIRSTDLTAFTEILSATGVRTDGPAMGVARRNHSITRLNNGKLLVIGGLGTDLWPLASAEIYE